MNRDTRLSVLNRTARQGPPGGLLPFLIAGSLNLIRVGLRLCFCVMVAGLLAHESVEAANYPLEVINIKPAGTGEPAIPSTNRIFRAYPGVEYNIRPAVIGGTFPFSFSLSNAPQGMSINPTTGEIVWVNPQSSSGPVKLSVQDSEGSVVNTSWTVNVGTQGFVFVDANYTGVSDGSIGKPFKRLNEAVESTGSPSDIIYFRQGSYTIEGAQETGFSLNSKSGIWLGYPGETVSIDGNRKWIYATTVYFDNIRFGNFVQYGINLRSNHSYTTIRRTVWDGLITLNNVNNNYGFSFTSNEGSGYYYVFQDNEFRNFEGSAIGSLYNTKYTLIENNYIHSPAPLVEGRSSIRNAIASKYYTDRLTIRANRIIMDFGTVWANSNNSGLVDTHDIDVSFNLFIRGGNDTVHRFNAEGYIETRRQHKTHYYRNTTVGRVEFALFNFDDYGCGWTGPYYMYENVIINSNKSSIGNYNTYNFLSFSWGDKDPAIRDCIMDYDNLFATPDQSPIDGEYKLKAAFSGYLGSRGCQLSDGRFPYYPPGMGNHAPVLSPIGNRSIPAGQQLQFTVQATDADGDQLQYSATGH